jgi:hypothetical protein
MWSCFAYICDVRMCLWCLLAVVAAISWMVPGCSPWWLPNPGWLQDATVKWEGYCRGGLHICNEHKLKLVTNTDQWVMGFIWKDHYKHSQNVTGSVKAHYQSWFGGPQDLARSSRYRRRRLKASDSFNREKADACRNRHISFRRDRGDAGSRNASLMLILQ